MDIEGMSVDPLQKGSNEEVVKKINSFILNLNEASVNEAVRLIESGKFNSVNRDNFTEIGNYHPIEINGEKFFDKAFSTGKEVALILRFAEQNNEKYVLKELKDAQKFLEDSKKKK